MERGINTEKDPKRKEALTKAKQCLDSHQTYRDKFLASQETRRTSVEKYHLPTLYRIGKAFIELEFRGIKKSDIYFTYQELGLGILQYCQDENSTVLSHVAAEYVYEAVKDNTDKKRRQSAEIYVEKCVEAHGEFILRFIYDDEKKRLKHLCTILIIALSE